jgi:hypothetical protein
MVPLLELQRRQQIAALYFSWNGPWLLKCSMVAPEAPVAWGDCFIKIRQYTQDLSLARTSRSTCSEIPYVLDMDFGDLYIRHFELGRLEDFIAGFQRLSYPTAIQQLLDW